MVVFSSEVCETMPKVQICPKTLSMILDVGPPGSLTLWLVLSPPFASASNGQC